MELRDIDVLCTNLPGVEVRYPFDSSPTVRAWCVHRRMFAWCATDSTPLTVQLKADPDLIPSLIDTYPFIRPGYHMNKRHWLTIHAQHDQAMALLPGLLEDAHMLVVAGLPARVRMGLLSD